MQVTVVDNAGSSRYEAVQDSSVVGFAAYRRRPDSIVFTHTEVEPGHEGVGIGSALARFALHDARTRQLRVIAQCPFIKAYIKRHPEYAGQPG